MNRRIFIIAAGMIVSLVAASAAPSYAATVAVPAAKIIQQQPPLRMGIPETSGEDFTVRKAALLQHVKDTVFRLSIEKSCIDAAREAKDLDSCQHEAPVVAGETSAHGTTPASPTAAAPKTGKIKP